MDIKIQQKLGFFRILPNFYDVFVIKWYEMKLDQESQRRFLVATLKINRTYYGWRLTFLCIWMIHILLLRKNKQIVLTRQGTGVIKNAWTWEI